MQGMVSLKKFHSRFQFPFLLFCFYAFVATALIAPIASNHFIPGLADYMNHLAGIIEAKLALAEGQFPIRVAPDWSGRYPYFQFYSPSSYTFAAIIYQYLTPNNPLFAFKLTMLFALTLGGVYMYRVIFWFVQSKHAAILGSLVYLMSPYYIVVINNFGDLSELIALAILPAVIFYNLKRYYYPDQYQFLLKTGLCWYLLLTTHIVTFIYSSFFIALLFFLVTIKNRHHWKNYIQIGISWSLGCLLAMWYFVPVVTMGHDTLISQSFYSASQFNLFSPTLSQLIFPAAIQFKSELIHNHPTIGWLILAGTAIAIGALFTKSNIASKRAHYWLPFLIIMFFIVFFLIWSPINIWQWLPRIFMIGQYSWRLLDQTIWIGAILFAYAIAWVFKNKLDLRHTFIGLILIAAISSQFFPNLENAKVNLEEFSKNPQLNYNHNAYMINFNQNTNYVENIDTIMLYSLMDGNKLHLNTSYIIQRPLVNFAANPTISISGSVPEHKKITLNAVLNEKNIATKSLSSGTFTWDIPITPLLNQYKDLSSFNFQIRTPGNVAPNFDIVANEVLLTGFVDTKNTLRVKQIEKNCFQKKINMICNVDVPANIQFIELPITYYPNMLYITRNGKEIPYESIVYYNFLLTKIPVLAGQKNHIKIQFRGITWANYTSAICWCIWTILLISVLGNNLRRHIRNNNHAPDQ